MSRFSNKNLCTIIEVWWFLFRDLFIRFLNGYLIRDCRYLISDCRYLKIRPFLRSHLAVFCNCYVWGVAALTWGGWGYFPLTKACTVYFVGINIDGNQPLSYAKRRKKLIWFKRQKCIVLEISHQNKDIAFFKPSLNALNAVFCVWAALPQGQGSTPNSAPPERDTFKCWTSTKG